MSLSVYRQKRRFQRTPEPRGNKGRGGGALRFVIQKHQASRLHYDFRLELDGVLKSWAVPKGPSLNPRDKRLAVMVEDHPLDYRSFEGTIPKGNYGAGSVIVWDEGTYQAQGADNRRTGEKALREGLAKGHLSLIVQGHKLRGEFSLIKLKRGAANAWLLVKKNDEFATTIDVTKDDRSVLTGRSVNEINGTSSQTGGSRKRRNDHRARPKAKADLSSVGTKSSMPQDVRPMLATLVEEPFDRAGWLFEPKWDGYRSIAEIRQGKVRLYSRNHNSFTSRFAPITHDLRELGHDAVLDGEVVVVDDVGRSQFQLLQNYQKTGKGNLVYYVFDILYLDGRDLRALPLLERKELLRQTLPGLSRTRLSEHVEAQGVAFFQAAVGQGLEGMIAKDGASPYRTGLRSRDWLKVKTHRRQEAVIGGFTDPRGRRAGLGALVLGVYEGRELVYIGHTGGGLDTRGLFDMRSRLDPLIQKQCPFDRIPATNAPVHWVAPQLVCEVSFQEWTQDGRMRQPIFIGLREDKEPRAVAREKSEDVGLILADRQAARIKPRGPGRRRSVDSSPKTIAAGRHQADPPLTNSTKVYWPAEGYTKGDLISYYRDMAPVILPYLRDRPMSLHRHPNGIAGQSFFQKDVSGQPPPDYVQTVTIKADSKDKEVTYVLCQNRASLLYIANLGCIELNPWNSRIGRLDRPDYAIIDLDPEDVPFARVVETAVSVRSALESAGLASVCKTSGKRGLHVFVPLGGHYEHEQARRFAEIIASIVHEKLSNLTSLQRSPALRQQRVYLDYLQNRQGQTVAAPYSVRPAPAAPVSTPLRWQEVNRRLDPTKFTIKTMAKRLDQVGDLWAPVLGPGVDLNDSLDQLARARRL